MINVLCIIGTRPEAIKMLPVIYTLRHAPNINCRIISTAQHRHMLDQVLNLFQISADIDLNIMQPNQSLNALAGRLLIALEEVLSCEKPQIVLAQGDTTTVMAAALSAFHQQIPFGHVEAGLRTGVRDYPFPEEMNRVLASRLAQWHFAPTITAQQNLLAEGIPASQVFLTGNTIIDMIRLIADKQAKLPVHLDPTKRLVLMTAHRREIFGEPLKAIFRAIRVIADQYPDIQILYPVHPNPNVKPVAEAMLSNHPNIVLCEPLDYIVFIQLMKKSCLIISDSGGIQEEALVLEKPLLLLREETERPEGVKLGGVTLVGHDEMKIIQHAEHHLNQTVPSQHSIVSPYGDGYAAKKIVDALVQRFQQPASREVLKDTISR